MSVARDLAGREDRVRDAYAGAIGRSREDLITPALILDLPAAARNIHKMAARMREFPAELRPHIKVHKSAQLAQMQIAAGAIGVATATVWEAIAMAHSGVDDVFVVNTVAGQEKLAALACLARDFAVLVAVDDVHHISALAAAAATAEAQLRLVIEIDTGMHRAGVRSADQAIALAQEIDRHQAVSLAGVTGYEGHCSLTPERDLRHQRQQQAMRHLVDITEALRERGYPCPIVSAGGTATWEWTASFPGVTELQAGSYVVMDNFHGAMVSEFEQALTVATTVISRSPDRVVVDAGNKSIGAPDAVTIHGHDLHVLRFDEEHGIFAGDGSSLSVGDVVQLVPGYSPSTVNWYDAYHVVEDDVVIDIWPILARGPGHGGLIG